MVKASPIQQSFNGGEFSPFLRGLTGLEKRRDALETMSNLIALKQGPAVRRGGTMFVKEIKDSSNRTSMIPFEFSETQNYQIEVGDQYFRFYRDNAIITETAQNITGATQANPVVLTYSGADNYANGDEVFISSVGGMTELNGKFYLVANVNVGANTFELTDLDGNNIDGTGFTAYTSGGTIQEVYEISSPYEQANLYDSDDVKQIHFVQSASVLYIFSESYKTRALVSTGDTSWTLNTLTFDDGPYLDQNLTSTTLTLGGTSGTVTVTASSTTGINGGDGFQSTDVGRLIRWRDPANNWTWLTITAFTSTTQVTATIDGPNASATTATTQWRLGIYSDTTGWPRTGAFHQERLYVGGNTTYPDTWAATKTGGYSDTELLFEPTAADGTVADDNGITGTLPSRKVNKIQWMTSDTTGMVFGTEGQEWTLKSSGAVATPSDKETTPISSTKSAYIQPLLAESGFIFVQLAKRKLHDMIYSFDLDRLKPRDVTLLGEHITANQVIELAYQQEPINVAWAITGAGLLIGMTYYPDQNVFAWHRHPIGGDGEVEAISVIPSSDASRDELWMIVKRTINGSTRRYVEYMTRYYEDDIALNDAVHIDSSLTYSGASTTTVTGLDHLEGETVKVNLDGKSHPDLTVSSGSVTFANNRTATKAQIGLSAPWIMKTMETDAGAADGTAQGKEKRIHNLSIKLLNTLGLQYGPDASTLDEFDFEQGQEYDETPALFSGNTPAFPFPDGYNDNGQIYLTDDGVFPATILALMPQLKTYDRG